jgi:hypothetical protein
MSKARDMPESQEQQVTGTELASVDKVCTVECAFHMLIKVCYLFIYLLLLLLLLYILCMFDICNYLFHLEVQILNAL